MSEIRIQPFSFGKVMCTTISELVGAMGMSWKSGKQFLFSGQLREHFKKEDKTIASLCSSYEKKFHDNPKNGDVIFLEWICKMPGVNNLYWLGRNYGGIRQVCTLLQRHSDQEFEHLLFLMMKEQFFSLYVKNCGLADSVVANVRYLERCYNKKETRFNKRNVPIILYHILAETKSFTINGKEVKSEQELAKYLQEAADISKQELASRITSLFQDDYNLSPVFESWLINMGRQKEIASWKDKYQAGVSRNDDMDCEIQEQADSVKIEVENQNNEKFAGTAFGFEAKFLQMLMKYPEVISDAQKFTGLMNDYFPQNPLHVHLLLILYKMDMVRALKDAKEINELFTIRFVKRMVKDFGIKEGFARWAVSVWCVCYGEQVLQRKNSIDIYKVI